MSITTPRYTIHQQTVTPGWKVVDNHTNRAVKMGLSYEDADFEAKRLNTVEDKPRRSMED